MARPPRLEAEGSVYHVIVRGNERRAIFRDDADREEYLRRLAVYRERFGFRLLAYCLMDNHIHFALERGATRLSRVMLALQGSYTQWFNRRHRRVGHLFQGRYKAFLVQRDRYLLALIRYIHENPVRAGVVERAQDYPWSSDRPYRRGSGPEWLDVGRVLPMLGRRRREAIRGYRRLMGEALEQPYEDAESHGRVVRGEEGFAQAQFRMAGEQVPRRRGLSVERIASAVAEAFGVKASELHRPGRYRELSRLRAVAAYVGREVAGHPIVQTARQFGREGSTLVRTVLRLESELAQDLRLDRKIGKLIKDLQVP